MSPTTESKNFADTPFGGEKRCLDALDLLSVRIFLLMKKVLSVGYPVIAILSASSLKLQESLLPDNSSHAGCDGERLSTVFVADGQEVIVGVLSKNIPLKLTRSPVPQVRLCMLLP